MRYVSWLLSIILHATLCTVLIQVVHLAPFELKDVMDVDLTTMEMPKEVAHLPVPQQPPPPEAPEIPGPVTAMPLPQDKTVVLDDSPPAPAQQMDITTPPPPPAPDVIEISPVKTDASEDPDAPRQIIVRKDDTIVHRGHEARFGRTMMGDYYSYSATEFSGQFKTRDDRTISIIDARNTKYGRFLIYDSKNKTLRRLKQFGKYVYTIGPSIHADEPVVGTVTFLAKNDRIERFILMTDDDRIAHYPRKVHVREDDVSIPTRRGALQGHTSLPPFGEGYPGVVFVHGNQCVEPSLIQGFTRALSARNLASLSFSPRGCDNSEGTLGNDAALVADTVDALDFLAARPQISPDQTGFWGNGHGVPLVIKAAANPGKTAPAYLICLLDDTISPESIPARATLAAVKIPTLWLVTGRNTGQWQQLIATLESVRDVDKRPFTIVVAPLKASQDVLDAESALSGWVEQVAEDHARLAVSWVQSHSK